MILYLLARKAWDEDSAQASALVLLTSLLFAALAWTAITDMLLCLCLTAAVAALIPALEGPPIAGVPRGRRTRNLKKAGHTAALGKA